jgi:hypothetical protein
VLVIRQAQMNALASARRGWWHDRLLDAARRRQPDVTNGMSDDTLSTLVETETGERVRDQPIVATAAATALSPDGQRFAIGTTDGRIVVLGPEGVPIVNLHPVSGQVSELVFAADGQHVAFFDEEGAAGEITLDSAQLSMAPEGLAASLRP